MRAEERLPNLTPTGWPELGHLEEVGILIRGPESASFDAPFVISGRFVLPKEDVASRGQSPHRDLVLSIVREPMYQSAHPMRHVLVFDDDLTPAGNGIQGWFNVNVWDSCQIRTPGVFHARVSLGKLLSNPIAVPVL